MFAGNEFTLRTPDEGEQHSYESVWLAPKEEYLAFTFQGCNDLHVALCEVPEVYTENCYEVVVGGWDNMRSVIRDNWHVSGNDDFIFSYKVMTNYG